MDALNRRRIMKAVRLVHPGQPLRMQELPVPEVGSRDVLIRVMAAGGQS
jgi:D-arabinose 1-dehydrogenase-like Zn-dependent alcohol dehydrogenase